jgi:hypothetical protein
MCCGLWRVGEYVHHPAPAGSKRCRPAVCYGTHSSTCRVAVPDVSAANEALTACADWIAAETSGQDHWWPQRVKIGERKAYGMTVPH